MSLIDSISTDVSSAWNDVTSTGVPAVIAGVENYAASQLQNQAKNNTVAAQNAANAVAASTGASSGVMQSVQGVLTQITSGAFIKQYGWCVVAGIFGIYVVARKL